MPIPPGTTSTSGDGTSSKRASATSASIRVSGRTGPASCATKRTRAPGMRLSTSYGADRSSAVKRSKIGIAMSIGAASQPARPEATARRSAACYRTRCVTVAAERALSCGVAVEPRADADPTAARDLQPDDVEIEQELGTRLVERVRWPAAVTVNVTVPAHGFVRRRVVIVTRARPLTRRERTLRSADAGCAARRSCAASASRRRAAATPRGCG